jgi:hypothetical protein
MIALENQWTGYSMGTAVVLDLPLAFVVGNTGSSNTLFAIDVDKRVVAWYPFSFSFPKLKD